MYRLIVESLLGLKLDVDKLRFAPSLPPAMTQFRIRYRYRETFFDITVIVDDSAGGTQVELDGEPQQGDAIRLVDDGRPHAATVRIGPGPREARVTGRERFGAFH
jgi:cellobiose phosphorylase